MIDVGQQRTARGYGSGTNWPGRITTFLTLSLLLTSTSCSANVPEPAVLDASKVASVVVGGSSRAEVFSALGRPSRTERSALGESWIYEAKTHDTGGQGLISGVSAASGVAGAFVPYAGLVGSGLGLAGTAMGKAQATPVVVSLAVAFAPDGVVRDCVYSSSAFPVGASDPPTEAPTLVDCGRPSANTTRAP